MDIIEYLGFWDWALIIYLVGLVLAFILIHDRLCKPECYRITTALYISFFWPVALLLALVIYIEGVIYDLANWILKRD
jgi:ABC-type amino acid transport system permease subunit